MKGKQNHEGEQDSADEPIGDGLMGKMQNSFDPTEIETIHIQLEGLPLHACRIPLRLRLRDIFAMTSFTPMR